MDLSLYYELHEKYICECNTTQPNMQAANTCLASEGRLIVPLV